MCLFKIVIFQWREVTNYCCELGIKEGIALKISKSNTPPQPEKEKAYILKLLRLYLILMKLIYDTYRRHYAYTKL